MSLQRENRLDPFTQIDNTIYRGHLYRDIINQTPYVGEEHWFSYEVSPGEVKAPELIAFRAYQDKYLKWVVLIAAKLNDYKQLMEDGETIILPSQEWLRDRIVYYKKMLEKSAVIEPVKFKVRRVK